MLPKPFIKFFLFFVHSGSRRKLSTLAIYTEEDSSIDMSGLATPTDANDKSDKSKINVSFIIVRPTSGGR